MPIMPNAPQHSSVAAAVTQIVKQEVMPLFSVRAWACNGDESRGALRRGLQGYIAAYQLWSSQRFPRTRSTSLCTPSRPRTVVLNALLNALPMGCAIGYSWGAQCGYSWSTQSGTLAAL